MKIEIKSKIDASILFRCEAENLKLALKLAIENKVSLSCAYLRCADLSGAYLRCADLSGAYLRGADLSGADLSCADLSCAYLRGAYLRGAYLSGADLSCAYLRGAYLSGAKLKNGEIIGKSERPFFTISPLGSDQRQLMAFSTDQGIRIQTGCFFGTMDEFKAALKKKHSKTKEGKEYIAAIALIETHFEIWAEK